MRSRGGTIMLSAVCTNRRARSGAAIGARYPFGEVGVLIRLRTDGDQSPSPSASLATVEAPSFIRSSLFLNSLGKRTVLSYLLYPIIRWLSEGGREPSQS